MERIESADLEELLKRNQIRHAYCGSKRINDDYTYSFSIVAWEHTYRLYINYKVREDGKFYDTSLALEDFTNNEFTEQSFETMEETIRIIQEFLQIESLKLLFKKKRLSYLQNFIDRVHKETEVPKEEILEKIKDKFEIRNEMDLEIYFTDNAATMYMRLSDLFY